MSFSKFCGNPDWFRFDYTCTKSTTAEALSLSKPRTREWDLTLRSESRERLSEYSSEQKLATNNEDASKELYNQHSGRERAGDNANYRGQKGVLSVAHCPAAVVRGECIQGAIM